MTTHFRTLLLLGFTGFVGMLSGCIIETTSDPGPYGGGCLNKQYFNVRWEVDEGSLATMFSCGATPPSHVELSTNTGLVLQVGKDCLDGRVCSDGNPCNWAGSTVAGIAVGTTAVTATLISDVDGSLLSSSGVPQVAIAACTPVELGFFFPI